MKNKSKCIAAGLAIVAASGFLLQGCSGGETSDTSSLPALRVGVLEDLSGMSKLSDTTGNYYGLEDDIAREMASRMGCSPEFISVTKDNREDLLEDGTIDCMIATYTISDYRSQTFDFSDSYYTDTVSVIVENSSLIAELSDLLGKTVGIIDGTDTGFEFAACMADLDLIPDFDRNEKFEADNFTDYFNIVKYVDLPSLEAALECGEIDAACADSCIIKACMTDDRTEITGPFEEQSYGVATLKGSDYSTPVSEAISSMLSDGTIDQLIEKWDLDDEN